MSFWKVLGFTIMCWVIAILIFAVPTSIWNYTQRYIAISISEAERGLIFTDTVDLTKQVHVGKGSGLFGDYEVYSRSDRQKEVIKVYKGK